MGREREREISKGFSKNVSADNLFVPSRLSTNCPGTKSTIFLEIKPFVTSQRALPTNTAPSPHFLTHRTDVFALHLAVICKSRAPLLTATAGKARLGCKDSAKYARGFVFFVVVVKGMINCAKLLQLHPG